MKVTLIFADWCNICRATRGLWSELQNKYNFEYEELSVTSPEGIDYVKKYAIHAVPVTLIEDRIAFVGLPDREKAIEAMGSK
ncbi:MAG: thioredoxin family protein [Candidatus Methanoperedens sp.]|nr:thioredoxin family protein [Candidatus Methanoperedens sp.]MCZ7358950.1 thioredoxin family protein [Candidatus Methanoperedens sp.]HLB70799.1 thioredoxin family protein [Candidatus Methanoperedens sp.]